MVKGERMSAETVSAEVRDLFTGLMELPAIKAQADAVAGLRLVLDEFDAWAGRFLEERGSANA